MDFPEKLYQLRRQRGLSQEKLAEELGVSRQAVSKWEGGQATPDTDKLLAISAYFGVSLDSLLKGEEAAPVPPGPAPDPLPDRRRWKLGLALIGAGAVCLLAWVLVLVLRPDAVEGFNESSMVTLNGSGVLLMLCIAAVVLGIVQLLRKS